MFFAVYVYLPYIWSKQWNDMTATQQLLIDNLRFNRKERKLTQTAIAEQCGMLPSTYSRLETGQVSPQVQTLERVCGAIGIEVADLFRTREIKDQDVIQKLEAINELSEYNRSVVGILLDSIIEKDKLEKSQEVKMRNRLEELDKARKNS